MSGVADHPDDAVLSAMAEGHAVSVQIHYRNGLGFWARVNGHDAGVYCSDWQVFAHELADAIPVVLEMAR